MQTDSERMLEAGVALAKETWDEFAAATGWTQERVDRAICHQVGSAHRRRLFETLGLDLAQGLLDLRDPGQHGLGLPAGDARRPPSTRARFGKATASPCWGSEAGSIA